MAKGRTITPALAGCYIPALDGLRALSILLVLGSHFGLRPVPGIFGVTIFFFVSGYLITGQILGELDRNGAFSLPGFYVRRALRLYPALLGMVVLGGIAFAAVGGRVTWADGFAATFYLGNLDQLLGTFVSGLPNTPHVYGVLWSLAVEEHFYLVFPVFALVLARRRWAFIAAMLALLIGVGLWRAQMAQLCAQGCSAMRIEHGTDTRLDSILYGALLAALLASPLRAVTLRLLQAPATATAGAALLALSLLLRDAWFRDVLRFTVQGIGLFLSIGGLLHAPRLARLRALAGRPALLLVGRWSYSLYLWHWVVLCLAMALLPAALAGPLVEPGLPSPGWLLGVFLPLVALSFAAAAASYYGIERPMLAVRRAFGAHALPEQRAASRAYPDAAAIRQA